METQFDNYLFLENIEIEARIKVNKETYTKILNIFKQSNIEFLGEKTEQDEFNSNLRKRGNQFIRKEVLHKIHMNKHTDLNFSVETPIKKSDFDINNITLRRTKHRTSFRYKFWIYDFTIVNGNHYEIELEICDVVHARRFDAKYLCNSLNMKVNDIINMF